MDPERALAEPGRLQSREVVGHCDALFDQHRCRALGIKMRLNVKRKRPCSLGERQGHGVLEQLIVGPHRPSGFTALMDMAK